MHKNEKVKFSHIGQIIRQVIGNNPLMQKRFSQYTLWNVWEEIVGARLATHAQPKKIHDTTLVVEVSHSGWIQELSFLKPQLLKKIHTHLSKELIRDIRFELKETL